MPCVNADIWCRMPTYVPKCSGLVGEMPDLVSQDNFITKALCWNMSLYKARTSNTLHTVSANQMGKIADTDSM